jgi:cation diffusion facilitator CzcD-associated flavoprotein CzcO
VVVLGGGMCGLVASFALQRAGIRNLRILDRSPAGREGPWVTYARMETLRSPKHLTGPAFGMGPLTFRAWFEAQFGAAEWEALDKIPRPMWMDYLRWYRRVLDLPVENGVEVTRVSGEGGLLRLEVRGGREDVILCRRLVMATGREGLGRPNVPGFVAGLERGALWAHSSDDIDFARLKGRRVGVVGVGASAVDNAAEALEAGCAECRMLIRRAEMPTINKMMGIGSYGFTAGYPELPDAWRWRFMRYSFVTQTPAPRGSTLRVSRHDNAHFHFGAGIERVERAGDGLRVHAAGGRTFDLDFLILGTGFTVEPEARTEFGAAARDVLLWRDVYAPPPDEAHEELGLFPYLAPDFAFRERTPGAAPWLRRVHCFNYGSTLSMGKVSGDIPAVSEGAAFLARAVSAGLYAEDVERHWRGLVDYSKPELLGDEWRAAE